MDLRSPAAFLLVGLGGAIGSVLRFAIGHYYVARAANPFLTVFTVNMAGSLLIGMVAGKIHREHPMYLLTAIGILGGFTTFSSFSLDLFAMIRQNMIGQALLYGLGQMVLGVVAAAIGFWAVGGR